MLTSGARSQLTLDYDVVDRQTQEVVLTDRATLACASGIPREEAMTGGQHEVVVTRTGERLEGLVRLFPGGGIELNTAVGVRHLAPSDVLYHGPADEVPELRDVGGPSGTGYEHVAYQPIGQLTLHRLDGTPDTLCVGWCDLVLGAGVRRLGLSRENGPILAAAPVDVSRSGTLRADYHDHSNQRAIGLPVLLSGLFAATVPAVGMPVLAEAGSDNGGYWAFVSVSAAASLALTIVGAYLFGLSDGAVLHFD